MLPAARRICGCWPTFLNMCSNWRVRFYLSLTRPNSGQKKVYCCFYALFYPPLHFICTLQIIFKAAQIYSLAHIISTMAYLRVCISQAAIASWFLFLDSWRLRWGVGFSWRCVMTADDTRLWFHSLYPWCNLPWRVSSKFLPLQRFSIHSYLKIPFQWIDLK